MCRKIFIFDIELTSYLRPEVPYLCIIIINQHFFSLFLQPTSPGHWENFFQNVRLSFAFLKPTSIDRITIPMQSSSLHWIYVQTMLN